MSLRPTTTLMLAALAVIAAGCAAPPPQMADVNPYPPPPPPRVEVMPKPPVSEAEQIWQPGHWDWIGNAYAWTPGAWTLRGNHSVEWRMGFWARPASGWDLGSGGLALAPTGSTCARRTGPRCRS